MDAMLHRDAVVLDALLSMLAGFIAPFAVRLACEQVAWLCGAVADAFRRMVRRKGPPQPQPTGTSGLRGPLWTLSLHRRALQRIVDDLDKKRRRGA